MHSFVSFLPPLPSSRPFFAYPGYFLAHRLVLGVPVLGCIPSVHCPLVPTTFPTLRHPFFSGLLVISMAELPSNAQLKSRKMPNKWKSIPRSTAAIVLGQK